MNDDVLASIHDLIEQPPPQVCIATFRSQLRTHHAAVEKAYTLLSTWESLSPDQANSIYIDLAERNSFNQHLKQTITLLAADTLPPALSKEAKTLLAEADRFNDLCRRAGALCVRHTRPLAFESQTATGIPPITFLPKFLKVLREAVDRQNQAQHFFDDVLTGRRSVSLRDLAIARIDIQFNLEAADYYRAVFNKWATKPLSREQQNQLNAAIGYLEVITVSIFRIQQICQRLDQSREGPVSNPPPH